jgi:RNA polymerase sigma-70 factor (ECF subfamily)
MRDDVPPPALAARPLSDDAPAIAEIPDAALAARLAAGERPALDPLYRRYKGLVYRFALLWTGSTASAADVTQDVFVHLLTRAADFDPALGAMSSWLLGIARNFSRRRGAAGDDRVGELSEESDCANDEPAADDILAGKRGIDRLRHAITLLPPHYRDVLVLVELSERSYAETALICGCEINTVRSRLSRARGLLEARMRMADGGSNARSEPAERGTNKGAAEQGNTVRPVVRGNDDEH